MYFLIVALHRAPPYAFLNVALHGAAPYVCFECGSTGGCVICKYIFCLWCCAICIFEILTLILETTWYILYFFVFFVSNSLIKARRVILTLFLETTWCILCFLHFFASNSLTKSRRPILTLVLETTWYIFSFFFCTFCL